MSPQRLSEEKSSGVETGQGHWCRRCPLVVPHPAYPAPGHGELLFCKAPGSRGPSAGLCWNGHSVHAWLGHLCFFPDYWKKMAKVLRGAGHHLVPVKENLVDKIWTDRPERPCKPLLTLGLGYTGQNPAVSQPSPFTPPHEASSLSQSSESKSGLS